nr:zinc finger, CCHC-type [Tanacetum cinerariifolium]
MWLFKHKYFAYGSLSQYKARLIANGNGQQLCVVYDETFSSVVKRFLAMACSSTRYGCKSNHNQQLNQLHHLEEALLAAVRNAYTHRVTEQQEVACLMLVERLGYLIPLVLRVNLILTSLSKYYDQFVQNYNMHDMGKTTSEPHAMLKLAEKSIPKKALAVLARRQ